MLLFAVVISVRINMGLASVIAIAIPVLSCCIYFILRSGLPYFEKAQQKLDKVNGVVQENLANVRVVKSFVTEEFEKKKFKVLDIDTENRKIALSLKEVKKDVK